MYKLRHIKIIGTGTFLPKNTISDKEIEKKIGVEDGWIAKKTGVIKRHFVENETASEMGAKASFEALKNANLSYEDIDCIICASGTMQQAIPSTASLIQREMKKGKSGTPAFDINSTCLSFVVALDTISYMMEAKRYKTVLIVSSEIASVGVNWEHKESASLFGDGAVAIIIQRDESKKSKILSSKIETYGDGASLSEIRGGGTNIHPRHYSEETKEDFLFHMNGRAIFKQAYRVLPKMVNELLNEADITKEDLKLVIPHQASLMAMRIMRKKLGFSENQFFSFIHNYGNMIAASIPIGIHEAIAQGKLNRGDKFLLLGTSAGLSIGGIVIEY